MRFIKLYILLLFIYSVEHIHSQTVYKIQSNRKVGLIDSIGKMILPPVYDYISNPVDGVITVGNFDTKQHSIRGLDGKLIKKIPYAAPEIFASYTANLKLFILDESGKKGLMNSKGEILVEPDKYTYFKSSPDGDFIMAVAKNEENLLRYDGSSVVPAGMYNWVRSYYNGIIITAETNDLRHVYNIEGKLLTLPFTYDHTWPIRQLYDSLHKYNLITFPPKKPQISKNTTNTQALSILSLNTPIKKDLPFLEKPKRTKTQQLSCYRCDNGWLLIKNEWGDERFNIKKDVYVFYKSDGMLAINETFNDAKPFFEGYAPVKKGDKWGYIDTSGKWLITPQYENAWQFSEGLAFVKIANNYAFIDSSGNIIISPFYTSKIHDTYFSEGKFRYYEFYNGLDLTTVTINPKGEVISKNTGNSKDNQRIAIYNYNLGVNIAKSKEPNYIAAANYYKTAALYGYGHAMTNLGTLYKNSRIKKPDGKPNYEAALYWLNKAKDELADANLGHMYELGQGVNKDIATALFYYTRSAMKPTSYSTYSMEKLAQFYGRGIEHIKKDSITAWYWVEILFKYDSTRAYSAINYIKTGKTAYQEAMALMASTFASTNEALDKMTIDMQKNNTETMPTTPTLQLIYLTDAKKALQNKNYTKAIPLLGQLHRSGNAEAAFLLGQLYANGNGVTKDMKRAFELYQQAASKNYQPAVEALKTFNILQ